MFLNLKITLLAVLDALRHVRVWLTLVVLVTVPALFLVLPIHDAVQEQLAHHPGATVLLNEHLDADLDRLHPQLRPDPRGAALFFLLATLFLGGGILSRVAVGQKFRYVAFLAESGRLLPRNLRVFLLGLLPALLLTWLAHALGSWLMSGPLRDFDPGGPDVDNAAAQFLSKEFGVFAASMAVGFLVLMLLFASRVARAWLVLHDRRSAVAAWFAAVGRMLRSPFTACMVVGWFTVLLLVPPFLIGRAVSLQMEVERSSESTLWLGYLAGLGGIAWLQVVNVAMFLAARRFLAATGSPAVPVASDSDGRRVATSNTSAPKASPGETGAA